MRRSPECAIEAENLGKRYRLYARNHRRVFEFLTAGLWNGHRELWALRNLDLSVARGTVLGVCGANGAGKSTLLRMLTGTTNPTEGRYRVRGRVSGMLELGTGFRFELSGRANLLYQALLLGYSRGEMQKKIDEIIEFSDLGSFIDEPLRTYSTGMAMRLGFCVAAMLDPDVLILDEVFAVGDIAFQKRCIDKMHQFKRENKTIVLCSHSMYDLRQLCDEAIWLRGGRLAAAGDTVSVTGDYASFMRQNKDLPELPGEPVSPNGDAPGELPQVREVRFYGMDSDAEVEEITTGDSIEIHVWWKKPARIEHALHLGIGLVREDNIICAGLASHFDGVRLEGKSGRTVLRLPRLQILSGRYLVPVWLLDETGSHRFHDFLPDRRLVVRSRTSQMGVFVPSHEWVTREG